jgi:hypothetical protein
MCSRKYYSHFSLLPPGGVLGCAYSFASFRDSSNAFCLSSALFCASSRAFSRCLAASSAAFSCASFAASPSPSALAGEADGEEDAGALGEAVCDEGLAGPWSGPVPTVTSTALPRSASVPAAGFCLITKPTAASSLKASSWEPSSRFAPSRRSCASSCDRPTTSGTSTRAARFRRVLLRGAST